MLISLLLVVGKNAKTKVISITEAPRYLALVPGIAYTFFELPMEVI